MHTRHDTRVMTRSPQPNVGILPGNRATCPQTIVVRSRSRATPGTPTRPAGRCATTSTPLGWAPAGNAARFMPWPTRSARSPTSSAHPTTPPHPAETGTPTPWHSPARPPLPHPQGVDATPPTRELTNGTRRSATPGVRQSPARHVTGATGQCGRPAPTRISGITRYHPRSDAGRAEQIAQAIAWWWLFDLPPSGSEDRPMSAGLVSRRHVDLLRVASAVCCQA